MPRKPCAYAFFNTFRDDVEWRLRAGNTRPDGPTCSYALAVFLTRPQAEHQIGAGEWKHTKSGLSLKMLRCGEGLVLVLKEKREA